MGVRHGSFDELETAEPFPGVERRVLDAEGATGTRYSFRPEIGRAHV